MHDGVPNKSPVTDYSARNSSSLRLRGTDNGGPHYTSNFRSDHPSGGQFAFADGSVRLVLEAMDMSRIAVYPPFRGRSCRIP